MKNLIFVFIFMTSFSFGQTNFDVMNPDAELLDSLVFDKIKQYQKDLFNNKRTTKNAKSADEQYNCNESKLLSLKEFSR